jgi:hypothetical protein
MQDSARVQLQVGDVFLEDLYDRIDAHCFCTIVDDDGDAKKERPRGDERLALRCCVHADCAPFQRHRNCLLSSPSIHIFVLSSFSRTP